MSPTHSEITSAVGLPPEIVSNAISSLRAVKPSMFKDIPQTKRWVTPQGKKPYEIAVDDYPAFVVSAVVKTLLNMSRGVAVRNPELAQFSLRWEAGEVDMRSLFLNKD